MPKKTKRLEVETVIADSVVAGRLEVRDREGRLVAVVGTTEENEPVLQLLDAQGRGRVAVSVKADGFCGLALCDADGRIRLELLLGPDGDPVLSLNGRTDQLCMGLLPKGKGSRALQSEIIPYRAPRAGEA